MGRILAMGVITAGAGVANAGAASADVGGLDGDGDGGIGFALGAEGNGVGLGAEGNGVGLGAEFGGRDLLVDMIDMKVPFSETFDEQESSPLAPAAPEASYPFYAGNDLLDPIKPLVGGVDPPGLSAVSSTAAVPEEPPTDQVPGIVGPPAAPAPGDATDAGPVTTRTPPAADLADLLAAQPRTVEGAAAGIGTVWPESGTGTAQAGVGPTVEQLLGEVFVGSHPGAGAITVLEEDPSPVARSTELVSDVSAPLVSSIGADGILTADGRRGTGTTGGAARSTLVRTLVGNGLPGSVEGSVRQAPLDHDTDRFTLVPAVSTAPDGSRTYTAYVPRGRGDVDLSLQRQLTIDAAVGSPLDPLTQVVGPTPAASAAGSTRPDSTTSRTPFRVPQVATPHAAGGAAATEPRRRTESIRPVGAGSTDTVPGSVTRTADPGDPALDVATVRPTADGRVVQTPLDPLTRTDSTTSRTPAVETAPLPVHSSATGRAIIETAMRNGTEIPAVAYGTRRTADGTVGPLPTTVRVGGQQVRVQDLQLYAVADVDGVKYEVLPATNWGTVAAGVLGGAIKDGLGDAVKGGPRGLVTGAIRGGLTGGLAGFVTGSTLTANRDLVPIVTAVPPHQPWTSSPACLSQSSRSGYQPTCW